MLFSCVPPTQICPASGPAGTIAIAESRLSGPWPELSVSHVVVSAGIANTVTALFPATSTTLTCASVPGSWVRKCVTYALPASLTAMARAFGHASWTRASTVSPRSSRTSSLVPWHVTRTPSPPGVAATP